MEDLFGSDSNQQQTGDPAGDFLARERAALGADANSFAAPADADLPDKDYEQSAAAFPDLDGADDDALADFAAPSSASAAVAAPSQVGQQVSVTGTNEFAAFEEEYPEIDIPSEQVSLLSRALTHLHVPAPGQAGALGPLTHRPHRILQPHENGLNGTATQDSVTPAFSSQPAASTPVAAPQDAGESEFIR